VLATNEQQGELDKSVYSIVSNILKTANKVGVESITIPLIGTGVAYSLGFGLEDDGLSQEEKSMKAIFAAIKDFHKDNPNSGTLRHIDVIAYSNTNKIVGISNYVDELDEKTGIITNLMS
jgi:hypothetical protein